MASRVLTDTGWHMHIKMHLATFLKFLVLSTGDKIRDVEKYAAPGSGLDFYKTSREGVAAHAQGKPAGDVRAKIIRNATKNAVEQNLEIFDSAAEWLAKNGKIFTRPPKKLWTSPKKVFSVQIEPEIKIQAPTPKIVAVYPRKADRIKKDQAGAAILFMQENLPYLPTCKYGIYDAFGKKTFWSPSNISSSVLASEIEFLESHLSRLQ